MFLNRKCHQTPSATDRHLSTVKFVNTDKLKIIQNLNPNKAHGHDKISIQILKICGNSELIFNNCLAIRIFPSDWKKGNIVPVQKKKDKQRLNNYRAISLLLICSKIFERLIENDLISQHQSGFKPGKSCINQLLSITQKYTNRSIKVLMSVVYFSTYLRPLIKVWHYCIKYGIIFKLK